jgi:hypothetical protein
MLRSKDAFLILIILQVFSGCIEPYSPNLNKATGEGFVVSGEVSDQEGYQQINVSLPSDISDPKYIPVSGCKVSIEDDKGNTFGLEEFENGSYRVWMDKEHLMPGTAYRVRIFTPSGDEIVSDFDTMPQCPAIDSFYYERKDKVTVNTEKIQKGLQFYIDFTGKESDSHFYRWTVDETWEYNSAYPREHYYDGEFHDIRPPDYTYRTCWITKPVKDIFTLGTNTLVSNSYKGAPIQFVDNTTNRLYIRYSALIKQHAISEAAYNFWEQLRIMSKEQGGLYERQPMSVKGNLHNLSNPEMKINGFFGAYSFTSRRIFVDGIRDMGVTDGYYCDAHKLGNMGWREFGPEDYPVYYTIWVGPETRILDHNCIDCRDFGGSLTKPDFWP